MPGYRRWTLTWNNPPEQYQDGDLPIANRPAALRWAIWQCEIGELAGTLHIQGYVELSASVSRGVLSRWIPQGHWEHARGDREVNRRYCSKEDGRTAGPWELGAMDAGESVDSDADADDSYRAWVWAVMGSESPDDELYHRLHKHFLCA